MFWEPPGRPALGLWLSLIEPGLLLASCSSAFFPQKRGPVWAVVKVRELGPPHRQPQAPGLSNVRMQGCLQPGWRVAGLEARWGGPWHVQVQKET